jgi:hypothetical protein
MPIVCDKHHTKEVDLWGCGITDNNCSVFGSGGIARGILQRVAHVEG